MLKNWPVLEVPTYPIAIPVLQALTANELRASMLDDLDTAIEALDGALRARRVCSCALSI